MDTEKNRPRSKENKFAVKINLEDFYQDYRKNIVTLVEAGETIKEVQKRIKKFHNIDADLKFMTNDYEFIAEKEVAEILKFVSFVRAFNPAANSSKGASISKLISSTADNLYCEPKEVKSHKRKFSVDPSASSTPAAQSTKGRANKKHKASKQSDRSQEFNDKSTASIGTAQKATHASGKAENHKKSAPNHVYFESTDSSSDDDSTEKQTSNAAKVPTFEFQCNLDGLENSMPRLFEPFKVSKKSNNVKDSQDSSISGASEALSASVTLPTESYSEEKTNGNEDSKPHFSQLNSYGEESGQQISQLSVDMEPSGNSFLTSVIELECESDSTMT